MINKIDIREHGTANAGASNVSLVMGYKYGIVTFLLDIFKVILAMWVTNYLFYSHSSYQIYSGLFAVIGHIYPFYLNFKGGKGVASFLGIYMGIDYEFGVTLCLMLFILTLIINYIGLTGIIIYLLSPFLMFYLTKSLTVAVSTGIVSLIGLRSFFEKKIYRQSR